METKQSLADFALPSKKWPVWLKCPIGNPKIFEVLESNIAKGQIGLRRFATEILNNTNILPDPGHINLVLVNSKDLDLGIHAEYGEILEAALCFGLKLCPVDAVIYARMHYRTQAERDIIIAAIEPLVLPNGHLVLLSLSVESGQLCLGSEPGELDEEYDFEYQFIFWQP